MELDGNFIKSLFGKYFWGGLQNKGTGFLNKLCWMKLVKMAEQGVREITMERDKTKSNWYDEELEKTDKSWINEDNKWRKNERKMIDTNDYRKSERRNRKVPQK